MNENQVLVFVFSLQLKKNAILMTFINTFGVVVAVVAVVVVTVVVAGKI